MLNRLSNELSALRLIGGPLACAMLLAFFHQVTDQTVLDGTIASLVGAVLSAVDSIAGVTSDRLSVAGLRVSLTELMSVLAGASMMILVYWEHSTSVNADPWTSAQYAAARIAYRFAAIAIVICFVLPGEIAVPLVVMLLLWLVYSEVTALQHFQYLSFKHLQSLPEEDREFFGSIEDLSALETQGRERLEQILEAPVLGTFEEGDEPYPFWMVSAIGQAADRVVVSLTAPVVLAFVLFLAEVVLTSGDLGTEATYRSVGVVIQIAVLILVVLQRLAEAENRIGRELRLQGTLDVSMEAIRELSDRFLERSIRGKRKLGDLPRWVAPAELLTLGVGIFFATWAPELADGRWPAFGEGEVLVRAAGFLLAIGAISLLVKAIVYDEHAIRAADPGFRISQEFTARLESAVGRRAPLSLPYRQSPAFQLDQAMRRRVALCAYVLAPLAIILLTWSSEIADPGVISSAQYRLSDEFFVRSVGGLSEVIAIPVLALILSADRMAETHLHRAEVHNVGTEERDRELTESHRKMARRWLAFARRSWPVEVVVLCIAVILGGWSPEIAELFLRV